MLVGPESDQYALLVGRGFVSADLLTALLGKTKG